MSIPSVAVNLILPSQAPFDLAPYIDISSSPDITDAIEAPHETNQFVAPDLSLKGYDDAALTVTNKLKNIGVTETRYLIQVWLDGAKIFDGFVLPNTVQFDQQERSFAFGAVGIAKWLSMTSAEGLFQRPSATGWTLAEAIDTGDHFGALVIEKTGTPQTCDFAAGDRISVTSTTFDQFGAATTVTGEYTVTNVTPNGTSPFATWTLTLSDKLTQGYAVGSAITLLTVYQRNVPLKTAVDGLFTAAGLAPPIGLQYSVVQISGTDFLASSPVLSGLNGTAIGVAPLDRSNNTQTRRNALAVTSLGAYTQAPPPLASWLSFDPSIKVPPADCTNQFPNGAASGLDTVPGFMLYGPRLVRERTPITLGGSHTFTYYFYDYSILARYSFVVKSADEDTATQAWDWWLRVEGTSDGFTWSAPTTLEHFSGTTSTALSEYIRSEGVFGITYNRFNETLYFTEPYNTAGAGSALGFRISAYKVATSTLVTNVAAVRGIPAMYPMLGAQGFLNIFSLDSLDGNVPQAYHYASNADSSLTATGAPNTPLPSDLQVHTLKYNHGDSVVYGLTASKENGVWLIAYGDSNLDPAGTFPNPIQLAAPGSAGDVDLCVIWRSPVTDGTDPMYAIFGDQLWWIDRTWTSIIPYLDLSGMSCADALAQLATLVDGYYYVDGTGASWFRTRSNATAETIANPLGVNSDVLDDAGCLALRTQPIWVKTYRYVSMTNEGADTITGAAGDPDFAHDDTLALNLTNRYVSTLSFAAAVAGTIFGYLGRGLRIVEVEHTEDGRRYVMGYTSRATVDSAQRQFQIIQTQRNPVSGLIRLVGLEL